MYREIKEHGQLSATTSLAHVNSWLSYCRGFGSPPPPTLPASSILNFHLRLRCETRVQTDNIPLYPALPDMVPRHQSVLAPQLIAVLKAATSWGSLWPLGVIQAIKMRRCSIRQWLTAASLCMDLGQCVCRSLCNRGREGGGVVVVLKSLRLVTAVNATPLPGEQENKNTVK